MPEQLHSEKSSQSAETRGKQKEGLFGDPPFAFFGLRFVDPVQYESDNSHNGIKYKKNSHGYIIIVEMRISNRHYQAFFKKAFAAVLMASLLLMPGCSIFDDDETSETSSDNSGQSTDYQVTQESGTESAATEPGSGFDVISKAYVYNAWYDVEKDNPVDYTSIDSNDAYALKCVFYFNVPVTGNFRAVLRKDGNQVAVKDIRIKDKVVCECDFSAGLEGKGTFDPGTYTVALENESKIVALSGDMRVN